MGIKELIPEQQFVSLPWHALICSGIKPDLLCFSIKMWGGLNSVQCYTELGKPSENTSLYKVLLLKKKEKVAKSGN